MILKQIPEDFLVDEIYDINVFNEKEEKNRKYDYFILTKKNYTVIKAIDSVARIFNVSRKFVNFAGTKDRVGITTQVISILGIKNDNLQKNLDFFNENLDDLNLEFLGEFKGRINLGDNLGNSFSIIVRDLEKEDISLAKKNKELIEKNAVLNFFDEQRFGYAQNSHIIGKYILKNEVEFAVKEILTSMPKNPKEDHINFVNKIKENWNEIKTQNIEVLNNLIEITPTFLRDEKKILEHLLGAKNDFPGAFRRIHKKIRTLYVNAYQSYIFNELIKLEKISSNNLNLELVHKDFNLENEIGIEVKKLLEKDGLSLENFELKSMPELRLSSVFRDIKIFPKDLEIFESEKDELNEGKLKVKISFKLDSGEYATNVVKQLFSN